MAETDSITAEEFLQSQLLLEQQAREAMPFDSSECTYSMGDVRQPVFACITCKEDNEDNKATDKPYVGVCYSCSIQCHSTHNLVELFSKRNFSCDCGTTKTPPCKIRPTIMGPDIPSSSNTYNHNFQGKFCSCSSIYSPFDGDMIQCYFGLACGEDWYHTECIIGYPKGYFLKKRDKMESDLKLDLAISSNGISSLSEGFSRGVEKLKVSLKNLGDNIADEGVTIEGEHGLNVKVEQGSFKEIDEGLVNANGKLMNMEAKTEPLDVGVKNESNSILEDLFEEARDTFDEDAIHNNLYSVPNFPNLDRFDCFICWKCVLMYKNIFKQFDTPNITYKTLPHFNSIEAIDKWNKESLTGYIPTDQLESPNENSSKRLYDGLESNSKRQNIDLAYSIFLKHDFKPHLEKLVKTTENIKLRQFFEEYKFLYADDPIYEPPADDSDSEGSTISSTGSLLDLGTDALLSLPKEQAIEGIHAYNQIRDKLKDFFRPFAEQGELVTEESVRSFFDKVKNEEK